MGVEVVLNSPEAERLTADILRACPAGEVVSTQVMFLGGKTLAQAKSGQIGYMMHLRNLCLSASGDGQAVLKSAAGGITEAVGTAPRIVGAALRIHMTSGDAVNPTYPAVGIIGLLGLPPEQAIIVLSDVLRRHGFFAPSALPTADKQG